VRLILAVFATGVVLGVVPTVGEAQYRAQSFESWEPPRADTAELLHLSDQRPPNYGLVGALIGGAVGIGLGVLANSALMNAGDGGGVGPLIVVVGGLAGALIGYGFGREKERHPAGP
jgi:hypothetical protein